MLRQVKLLESLRSTVGRIPRTWCSSRSRIWTGSPILTFCRCRLPPARRRGALLDESPPASHRAAGRRPRAARGHG